MLKKYFVCCGILFSILWTNQSAQAQALQIRGRAVDVKTSQTLPGANVVITNMRDTTDQRFGTTNTDGRFAVDKLRKGAYRVVVSFIGYDNFSKQVNVGTADLQLGTILLNPTTAFLQQVTVLADAKQAMLKGDTTEFTAAAFKVTVDAVVEDLVKKIPGVSIENGVIKAQGEEVKTVLVDGKPFFGSDPSLALKNLPADVVDRVQVFDKKSDQSELTGFDDGESSKTINIITRSDRRNGTFGKVSLAYGDQQRYNVSGNFSQYAGDKRLSLIGSSNNVNQQGFGRQDFLGAMNNRNNSSQSGISTLHTLGGNYSNTFGKLKLNGSYFFNGTQVKDDGLSISRYILSADSSRITNSQQTSDTQDYNHRLDMRLEWAIDSMNTFILMPSVNFQLNKDLSNTSDLQSLSVSDLETALYDAKADAYTRSQGYNIGNRMTFRHKFNTDRRTLSVDFNTKFKQSEPYSTSLSAVNFYTDADILNTNRIVATTTHNNNYVSNLVYTEPIGTYGMWRFNATNSYTKKDSYKQTTDFDPDLADYLQIDTLSNKYSNTYITNRLGVGYNYSKNSFQLTTGVEYQQSDLSGNQTYPKQAETTQNFSNWLPNARIKWKMSSQTRIDLRYRTSTNEPSIDQLQDVAAYSSNMTSVVVGNPNLQPEYLHDLNSRIMYVDKQKGTNLFFLLGASATNNSISNATIYRDNLRITTPVNIGTSYDLRTMVNYGVSIKPIRCNFNISGGYNYDKAPGFVNGNDNTTTTQTFNNTVSVNSNISENLDFTLSNQIAYSTASNTVSIASNTDYYTLTSGAKLNWIFWNGFTLQIDATYKKYGGLSSDYNQNFTLLNTGFGKKFLHNRAEFRLTAYDLLNKGTQITRTITANQITDKISNTLSRYFLLSFTYNFRSSKSNGNPDEGQRGEGHYRGDRPMGPPQGPPPGE